MAFGDSALDRRRSLSWVRGSQKKFWTKLPEIRKCVGFAWDTLDLCRSARPLPFLSLTREKTQSRPKRLGLTGRLAGWLAGQRGHEGWDSF